MPNATLPGHATPSPKSINVELNLLEAWRTHREAEEAQWRKSLLLIGGFLLLGLMSAQMLGSSLASQWKAEAGAQKSLKAISLHLNRLAEERKVADPKVARQQMLDESNAKAKLFLSQFARIGNDVPATMALTDCKVDVLAGEITLRGHADAESLEVAKGFVESASKTSNVTLSLLVSSRRSNQLSDRGISFEFVQKVGAMQ